MCISQTVTCGLHDETALKSVLCVVFTPGLFLKAGGTLCSHLFPFRIMRHQFIRSRNSQLRAAAMLVPSARVIIASLDPGDSSPSLIPIIKLLMVTGDAVRAILLYKGNGRRVFPVLFVLRSRDL
jgi:hypothetical protein